MPYGGSGANKAPIGQLNPILLGQKKETGGTSLLAQHLNKRREKEAAGQRQPGGFNEGGPWDNQQQSNYRQQGNYNQQGSYNQHQGSFGQQQGGYNQQQGGYNQQHQQQQQQQQQGGYSQQGQYNQQRDYNNQSSYNAPSQNYGDSRQYDNRNQQSRPYNQGPPSQPPSGQAPYNQYQSAPPPSGSQSSSYGSGFQAPPPSFNAPPPNSNMPPVQGFPPSGFSGPPPPLPKPSSFNQPPPSFGGPPPPQVTPTSAPPPPAPSSNSEQPPLPATAANRVGREGRESRSSPPKKRKKRSRWGDMEEKIQIPGLPSSLPVDATQEQREEYLLHFKIEEISIKLRSGNLGIPENPEDRSPSPEPIYNTEGKRLNTREYRVRKRLEEERHNLVQQASMKNTDYKPPVDYRPPSNRMQEKVMIPQDANPAINFIGLLIGPRGNTLKKMEKDTNCKIIIRGKGSVKEGKGRPGFPLPGENEPLHALVTGPTVEEVKNAVKVIEKIIKEGVETPEGSNELRKMQLRELAALNGTLIEEDIQRCRNCGATDHRHWECTEVKNITSQVVCTKCGGFGHVAKDCTFVSESGTTAQPSIVEKAKMDDEYMSLMAELGVDAPVPKATSALSSKQDTTPAPAIAAPPSASNDQTTSKTGTSSAPWSAPHEPKPLMSVNPTYTPRATPPKPLMSSQAPPPKTMMPSGGPPGHAPQWPQQRGPPPRDLGAQRPGGPRGPAPPWAQGPGAPSSNMRGPPPPAPSGPPTGPPSGPPSGPPTGHPTGPPTGPPPPGAPPPWQADSSRQEPRIQRKGPPPPWQQTPPPPAAAAPYAPPVGYGVPPRGVMYPQMGQPPPMPPWSAPPPPPPPPS